MLLGNLKLISYWIFWEIENAKFSFIYFLAYHIVKLFVPLYAFLEWFWNADESKQPTASHHGDLRGFSFITWTYPRPGTLLVVLISFLGSSCLIWDVTTSRNFPLAKQISCYFSGAFKLTTTLTIRSGYLTELVFSVVSVL